MPTVDGETLACISEVLERVAQAAGVNTEVEIDETADAVVARYKGDGDELAILIGHHGQALDAIQHLAQRIGFRGAETRKPLTVDAGGYRARRATILHGVADQAVQAALRDGRAVVLEAMGSQERKVIHEYLKERVDVETYSEGQEPARHLVVAPVGR
ncbi:MAG: protein jag [Solirubrobacteraceae bacterium]